MSARDIGVGILGTGFARSTQIPCFEAAGGFALRGLLSRDEARAASLAEELGVARGYADLDALLADEAIELVVVSTPPHLHLPQALAALRAGKHVLCEKPTALTGGEAAEMLAAARASGRLHLLDHELRFHPRRQAFLARVRAGFLGRVLGVDYRMTSAFRLDAARPWTWWSDAAEGGGVLGALGSHAVDAIRTWFGEVREARGDLRTVVPARPDPEAGGLRPVTADDEAVAWLRLAAGGTVNLTLSAASREDPGTRIAAHGEKGSLLLDEQNRLWTRGDGDSAWIEDEVEDAPPPPAGSRVPDTVWARAFLLYAARIRDALRAGETSLPGAATFEDGLRNQLVLDAIRESSRRASWVTVDGAAARA